MIDFFRRVRFSPAQTAPSSLGEFANRLLAPYRASFAVMILALVATSSAVLFFGKALGWLVDDGFVSGDASLLDRALLTLLGVILWLAVATYWRSRLIYHISERITADVQKWIFYRLLQTDPTSFENRPASEITHAISHDTAGLTQMITNVGSIALRNILLFLGGVLMLVLTSPRLSSYLLLLIPAVLGPIIFLGQQVRSNLRDHQKEHTQVSSMMEETLALIRTVHVFVQASWHYDRFVAGTDHRLATIQRAIRQRATMVAAVIGLVFGAVVLMVWAGGREVLAGRMSAGTLSTFLFYAVVVASSAGWLSDMAAEWQRMRVTLERLLGLIQLPPLNRKGTAHLPLPVRGVLEYHHIHFAYPSRPTTPIFEDFSLSVAAGEKCAIIGPSGTGKSTLFHLLLRFYEPSAGTITVDGVSIATLGLDDLRRMIGYVGQEAVLWTGSIAENLRYGTHEPVSDEALMHALEEVGLAAWVRQLPDGLESWLGDRGVQLSGGQRQRLHIARLLLRSPSIILLDEITSQLDAANEAMVQDAIDRLCAGRTTLIIAHRPSMVRQADRVILLELGRPSQSMTVSDWEETYHERHALLS